MSVTMTARPQAGPRHTTLARCKRGGQHAWHHLGAAVYLCTRGGEIAQFRPVIGRGPGMPQLDSESERLYREEQWL